MLLNRQRLSRVAEGTGPKKPQQPGASAKVLIPARKRAFRSGAKTPDLKEQGEIRSQLIRYSGSIDDSLPNNQRSNARALALYAGCRACGGFAAVSMNFILHT